MTQEGLKKLIDLFLNDISKMTYMQDEQPKEKEILESSVDETTVRVTFKINANEKGEFKDFKLIGKSGTVYATKNINITKTGDTMIHEFSFKFAVEEE